MLVKFFKNKGGGSPNASMAYLLKKQPEHIRILQGNPRFSRLIANDLSFKNKYTVGCLSFEEDTISEAQKWEIMDHFEDTLFAGLNREQYNICWIEHTDKGRLELNFFIPNVELTTQKALTPYFDRADRPLVDSFQRLINQRYDLSDPDDPQKRQMTISGKNLPKSSKDAVEAINGLLEGEVKSGHIRNRKELIQYLKTVGFEIAREGENYISIKNEKGRNLRLKGAIYERTFEVGAKSQTNSRKEERDVFGRLRQDHAGVEADFERAIKAKKASNLKKYRSSMGRIISESRADQSSNARDTSLIGELQTGDINKPASSQASDARAESNLQGHAERTRRDVQSGFEERTECNRHDDRTLENTILGNGSDIGIYDTSGNRIDVYNLEDNGGYFNGARHSKSSISENRTNEQYSTQDMRKQADLRKNRYEEPEQNIRRWVYDFRNDREVERARLLDEKLNLLREFLDHIRKCYQEVMELLKKQEAHVQEVKIEEEDDNDYEWDNSFSP
ncbi:relaxase family protein [Commensalibacter oyaizuii]|uniref:Relaxase/mobilization nuclease domain-containing protein n=1 Tax=Commensalibacter oyaizuii TaxID=3043873 RepID=A0ABT6Q423_9PROT|nr:relaxase/mobilization nuclease domain-containing protein [Commensalibacter sp. TBRC 16381]MDI2091882.1 relaxase/mobilization nuclease domain-containing protein [Commensalibacter sp. TBRC 16381]